MKKFNEFVDSKYSLIKELIEEVEYDCGTQSDLNFISTHESYKKIIEFGVDAIPLLLEKINESPFWYIALRNITGEEPDKNDSIIKNDIIYTDMKKVRESWKKWAKENGY